MPWQIFGNNLELVSLSTILCHVLLNIYPKDNGKSKNLSPLNSMGNLLNVQKFAMFYSICHTDIFNKIAMLQWEIAEKSI